MKRIKSISETVKGKCPYCSCTVQNIDAHNKEKHLKELKEEHERKLKERL